MTFRRHTFPEVLDNLLTNITGGVAAEAHPFPPPDSAGPPFEHSLQQPPAADVISVYGSRDSQPQLFRKDADYKLKDPQTLRWEEGAQLPDPGTVVYVNYYPKSSQPLVSDLHVGSVVRTLAETVALEIAGLYAQLEGVYQSAFVDTATGKSLDNVVALLGIERAEGGRASGEVEFTRSPASAGAINIPAGTRIITADGQAEYETIDTVTLVQGRNTIRVVARDLEAGNDPLAADTLTVLPVPIAGITKVTNPAPTAITDRSETDDELRRRAKSFLYGSERATLGAIEQAITSQGVRAEVTESSAAPGRIEVTLHADRLEPELHQRILTAVAAAKPAGVFVVFKDPVAPRKINLELYLKTAPNLLEQALRAIQREVSAKITDYFAQLPTSEPGSINQLVGQVMSIQGVEDVRIVKTTIDATNTDVLNRASGQFDISGFPTALGSLHIADPNLPTQLAVVILAPPDGPQPVKADIQAALNNALAYVNALNAVELPPAAPAAEQAKRALSYGKLLRVVPLPNKPGEPLEPFDAAASPPALPTDASAAPYKVSFVFTQESGFSQELKSTGDVYALTPFERLTLGGVEVGNG